MSRTEELVEIAARTQSLSYAPQPVVLARGEGVWLEDIEGRRYLDFLAGIAVSTLGHGHPALVEAIRTQAERVLHVSNAYLTEPQVRFQEALLDSCFADRAFFCNSGAEANEAAIKLARRYQRVVRGTPRFEVIVFGRSFHGRTMGALSATAQPKYHAGFEPMVPGFVTAQFGDLDSVRRVVGAHTAAILVEPVQGEGGIIVPPEGFLPGLREVCDAEGLLLIFDEVQCGIGRTGRLHAHEHFGVVPDIVTLAKGIGGGVPLGAMLATAAAAEGFTRGSHATTYGGNPLVTAAALAVLGVVRSPGFLDNVRTVGEHFRTRARELAARTALLGEVRGVGLMNGIALRSGDAAEAGRVVAAAREEGLLLNTAGGHVLRFVPPLTVGCAEVDEAMARLERALVRVEQDGCHAG